MKKICKNCRFFSYRYRSRGFGECLNRHIAVIDDEFDAKNKHSIYMLSDTGFDDTILVGKFFGCHYFKQKIS